MDRIVCPISGHLCHDSDGVRAHVETLRRLNLNRAPNVYRCSNAVMHPERPYHVGHRRNLRRAA